MDVQTTLNTVKDYAHRTANFLTELEQTLEKLEPVILQLAPIVAGLVSLAEKHFSSSPTQQP